MSSNTGRSMGSSCREVEHNWGQWLVGTPALPPDLYIFHGEYNVCMCLCAPAYNSAYVHVYDMHVCYYMYAVCACVCVYVHVYVCTCMCVCLCDLFGFTHLACQHSKFHEFLWTHALLHLWKFPKLLHIQPVVLRTQTSRSTLAKSADSLEMRPLID